MKADYLSYRRAANRSLLGLAIQLAMGVALMLYAIYAKDPTAMTASWFVLTGAVVWAALAIAFDLHRRERLEAMEAEAFAASDAATSSVFEQGAADLRIAANRLKVVYRFYLPVISIALGALLLGLGVWRFNKALPRFDPEAFARIIPSSNPAAGIAVGIGCAFVGFVFARYIAGMAKQKMWAGLSAGAAMSVGGALFGLALGVGHFVDYAGPDTVLRYLHVVLPLAMAVVGAEVLFNQLLEFYRPRKPGELPKPAFDSRILGFVAAPDLVARSIGEAISYQLGQDITSSWFYQLMQRSWKRLALTAVLVAWAMSTVAVVRPHQRALVLRFGADVREVGPGLHFKLPWPIDRLEVPEYLIRDAQGRVTGRVRTATGVRTLHVGTKPPTENAPILWATAHGGQEMVFMVHPPPVRTTGERADAPDSLRSTTRDISLVAIEVPVVFTIDDDIWAYEKLGPPESRDAYLTAVAQRELSRVLSGMTLTDVLAVGKERIAAQVRSAITDAFARINPRGDGKPVVNIVSVAVHGVHPPRGATGDVTRSFEEVLGQEQKVQGNILNAEAEATERLVKAAGSVEVAREIIRSLDALDAAPAADPEAQAARRADVATLIRRAGGEAAAMLNRATAERWARHMGERTALATYQGRLDAYTASPAIYRAYLYFDVLKGAMSDARLYITDPIANLTVRPNMEDKATEVDAFGSQAPSENP